MGADVNISSKSWNNATSLHFCSQLGKLQNIRLLLNYGANMYIKDKCGLTARDRAKKHPECEEMLLKQEGLCVLYSLCWYYTFLQQNGVGALVRALTFHQCGPVSIRQQHDNSTRT